MLELDELDKFIDELSSDAFPNHGEIQRLKNENAKIKGFLRIIRKDSSVLLTAYRDQKQQLDSLESQLKHEKQQYQELQIQFNNLKSDNDENEARNVNEIFHLKETIAELEDNHSEEHQSYIQLSKEYFELLSDATCFHNYVVKKSQRKIISKTEQFLLQRCKGGYKIPKILQPKRMPSAEDEKSIKSQLKTRKRSASKDETKSKKKLKTTELNEFQSISQVSSPMNFNESTCDDGEISSFSVTDSGISFSTSFSPKSRPISTFCSCNSEDLPKLVSIGTNTEEVEEFSSLPILGLDEVNEIDTMSQPIDEPKPNENILQNDDILYETMMDISIPTPPSIEKISVETSTDSFETVDKCVNTNPSITVTRATSTIKIATKNFSMQFPEEVSIDKIFNEFSFELPDALSPLNDLISPPTQQQLCNSEKLTANVGTITDLNNVNRHIDYSYNQPLKIKIEKSSFDERVEMDEVQFAVLGKTIFNLLLQRVQQNRKLNDEGIKDEIWEQINRQFLEKGSEIDISFTESEKSLDTEVEKNVEIPRIQDIEIETEVEKSIEIEVLNKEIELIGDKISSESDKEIENISQEHDFIMNDFKSILSPISEYSEPTSIEIGTSNQEILNEIEEPREDSSEIEKESQNNLVEVTNSQEYDYIMNDLKSVLTPIPECLEPINDDICDTIWNSIFPENQTKIDEEFDSPKSPENILEDFDFENDLLEIPMEAEIVYSENDTPKSPPPFINQQSIDPIEIPQQLTISKLSENDLNSIIKYDHDKRQKLVRWQLVHTVSGANFKVNLKNAKRSLKNYLEKEWTDESVDACLKTLVDKQILFIERVIFEVVAESKFEKEICTELTPSAPALPRYLQKLILLIHKLSQNHPTLPKHLIENLEENLFKCQKTKDKKVSHEDLRNFAYYYSSLVDLFFEGNTSMVFYFIVKSIYFFEQDAIPLIFVLIKAFPMCLVKKSYLLKKLNPEIDWENMSGLDISKVQLNSDDINSLDLTVMFILTFPPIYDKFKLLKDHELFKFVPRYYGFYMNFMTPKMLLTKLMKRLEDGKFDNISLSFIIFAKIMPSFFTIETLLHGNLIPFLLKLSDQHQLNMLQKNQICILLETISSILKAFNCEKERSIKAILPKIIEIYGRHQTPKLRESCLKALLRLQKFTGNHKEIFSMLKHHVMEHKNCISSNLYSAIETFIYRKNETCFNELNSA